MSPGLERFIGDDSFVAGALSMLALWPHSKKVAGWNPQEPFSPCQCGSYLGALASSHSPKPCIGGKGELKVCVAVDLYVLAL